MRLDVRILGPVRVVRDDGVVRLGGQARAVLALLALRYSAPVPAELLIEELYPAGPPRTARVNVQGLVCTLRRALAGPAASPIGTEPGGYALRLATGQLDLLRFRSAYEHAAACRRTGRAGRAREAVRSWERALGEWSGNACADLELPAVRRLVAPLNRRYVDAVARWAEMSLAGDPAEVAERLYREVAARPFHERMRELLITALSRAGRRVEALDVYEQGRRYLAEELGLDPSPHLRRLHRDLLTGVDPTGRIGVDR